MLSKTASEKALRSVFRKRPVAELEALFGVLNTRSRMSVFRRLSEIGYCTSYTHTRRYYTLADIPEFDSHGLWRHQTIGFSRFGTLKDALAHQVESADVGCTHAELEGLFRIRVYNSLLLMVRAGKVDRETIDGSYVYVSLDQERARRQLDARRERESQTGQPSRLPSEEVVQMVLVEALQGSRKIPAPSVVAARLVARGEEVSSGQVKRIYDCFGLASEKKTARR